MAVPSFLIKNGSSNFLNKQKNLFDVLNSVEKEKKTTVTNDEFMEVEPKSNKRRRKETKQFRGKESLFKEPVELPLRFKKTCKVPDFQKNPHKWTKYSLANITQDEMSNESNTEAALSFLREIKNYKKQQTIKMEVTDTKSKVISSSYKQTNNFHQFSLLKQEKSIFNNDKNFNKPVFKSSKLIMPEYVVGQAHRVTKTTKKIEIEKGKEIYLNHIHEYEDE